MPAIGSMPAARCQCTHQPRDHDTTQPTLRACVRRTSVRPVSAYWREFFLPGLSQAFGPAWWVLLGLATAGLIGGLWRIHDLGSR